MSDITKSFLAALNQELTELASRVVGSTAIVTGQTRDFGEASGSAWLYDSTHLVTNNHVVEDLVEPIWVRLPDRDDVRSTLVGRDPLTDLAVLKLPDATAEPLTLRGSPPILGELCFPFGSPLGRYPESISFGIVSGLKRDLPVASGRAIFDVIQTDCAINPGNSGGPLVGVDGWVIGVNSAVATDAEGIGFAIPAEVVADIVPEILTYGEVKRVSLGLSVAARRDHASQTLGLVVTAVGSDAAGSFEPGDLILTVAGREVHTQYELTRSLGRAAARQPLIVTVLRRGQEAAVECATSLES